MKPVDMCKFSNLARIIAFEEPLDSSEPKRNNSQSTTMQKGSLFTTSCQLAYCIPSTFLLHYGVSLPNAMSPWLRAL